MARYAAAESFILFMTTALVVEALDRESLNFELGCLGLRAADTILRLHRLHSE